MLPRLAKQASVLAATRSRAQTVRVGGLTGRNSTARSSPAKRSLLSSFQRRSYMVPSFAMDTEASAESIIVSQAVADRINDLRKQDKNKNLYLRIVVDSGGCNGFLAKFELDDKKLEKDDVVVHKDGAQIVLDELSMGLMRGSEIDYVDEMSRSTFVIVENPNAGTSCGCNTSFSLKDKPDK